MDDGLVIVIVSILLYVISFALTVKNLNLQGNYLNIYDECVYYEVE